MAWELVCRGMFSELPVGQTVTGILVFLMHTALRILASL